MLTLPNDRIPRRRSETRRRLLEATRELLLEGGVSAVTVDAVTGRAGYTRGAFYSNFATLDELVFSIYAEHQADVLTRLTAAFDRVITRKSTSTKNAVEDVVEAMTFDLEWLRIRINFASQAQYDSALAGKFVTHERDFLGALQPVLVGALAQLGLAPTVPADQFTRAVVAAHNGALANSVPDPDPSQLRRLVCSAVILSLTQEIPQREPQRS